MTGRQPSLALSVERPHQGLSRREGGRRRQLLDRARHRPLPGRRERGREVDARQDADRRAAADERNHDGARRRRTSRAIRTMPGKAASRRSSRNSTWSTSSPFRRTSRSGWSGSRFGFLVKSDLDVRVVQTLAAIEPSIDPSARVSSLSVAQKQIVEIARAASSGASVIIMDEPTAALSEREVERLFGVIRRLRESDVTVIYISHKLDEIFRAWRRRHGASGRKAHRDQAAVGGRRDGGADRDDDRSSRLPALQARERLPPTKPSSPPRASRTICSRTSPSISSGARLSASTGSSALARPRSPGPCSEPTRLRARSASRAGRSVTRPKDAIAVGYRAGSRRAANAGPVHHLTIRENISVMNLRRLSDAGVYSGLRREALRLTSIVRRS